MLKKIKSMLFEGDVLRLMGMAIMVRPIGLVTQMILANYYGASSQYDAYVLAFFLVNYVQSAFGRVFTAVITPFAINLKKEAGKSSIYGFLNSAYIYFLIPGIAFVAFVMIRSDILVWLAGPGAPPETKDLAQQMLLVMALPGLAMLLVLMGNTTLNLNRLFRVPGAMPIVYSALFLAALLVFHPLKGIWALPIAFSIGVGGQLLVLTYWNVKTSSFRFTKPEMSPGTKARLWHLSWVLMVAMTFLTINSFLDKIFASGLEPGSISSIAYSSTLMNFGVQLFSVSLVTVMFTKMSAMLAEKRIRECDTYIAANLTKIGRLVVPASLGLSMISTELITVLFERGAFGSEDTVRTASVLSMYTLGLPALIFNTVITRVFHSLQMMRARLWLSLQYLLTNVIGNFLLIQTLKVTGLALSSTIAINLHLFLSLLVLHGYGLELGIRRYTGSILRLYVVAALTWLILEVSGLEAWFDVRLIGLNTPELIVFGACRFLLVAGIFYGIYFVSRYFMLKAGKGAAKQG